MPDSHSVQTVFLPAGMLHLPSLADSDFTFLYITKRSATATVLPADLLTLADRSARDRRPDYMNGSETHERIGSISRSVLRK